MRRISIGIYIDLLILRKSVAGSLFLSELVSAPRKIYTFEESIKHEELKQKEVFSQAAIKFDSGLTCTSDNSSPSRSADPNLMTSYIVKLSVFCHYFCNRACCIIFGMAFVANLPLSPCEKNHLQNNSGGYYL